MSGESDREKWGAPALHLTWSKGGHAEVVRLEGDGVVLRSTTPAPPGARLEAKLVTTDPPLLVKIKSHGTRREEDGSFTLKGRLIDAPRDLRDKLGSLQGP